MEATESVLRAGYRLDRYELLCPIATGGMATVWLARLRGKRGFEKLFAIKTIRTELVEDPRFEEMFLDEARIASGIIHPNVAQILDLGEQDDVLFIVMEWVDGDSLAKIRKLLSKRGAKLPVGIVLRVLAEACAGLHAAHELRDSRGEPLEVVHRDVSPHNILLSTSGGVKIIDFGIAKAQNRRQGQTQTGIVKGKLQYMAPEQINKDASVDRRADVWALGMCLHELALGRLPYEGDDDVDVIRKLMGREPPTVPADAPAAIARVLERSVVLDPDARFPTLAGMQRALEAAMKELGETASNEDVAAFLRSELPDLARKRREAVGRAVEEARERGAALAGAREEDAFAPTLVGERGATGPAGPSGPPEDEARAIALTQRRGQPVAPGSARETSHGTHAAALDLEPIKIPKRSRVGLWAALLLLGAAGGAAAFWPQLGQAVLTVVGPSSSAGAIPVAATRSNADPGSPPESPPRGAPERPVHGTVTLAPELETTAMGPGATATAPSSGRDSGPGPSSTPRALAPPSSAGEAASAFPPADSSWGGAPLPGASAAPSAAPSATEDDPNNPYND